jgi:superfamily II DNA helicase RecQ
LSALKTWRANTARAAGVPAFIVLHDTTLAAIAELRPLTRDALLAVPGMGTVKADRYGQAMLELVAGTGAATA